MRCLRPFFGLFLSDMSIGQICPRLPEVPFGIPFGDPFGHPLGSLLESLVEAADCLCRLLSRTQRAPLKQPDWGGEQFKRAGRPDLGPRMSGARIIGSVSDSGDPA